MAPSCRGSDLECEVLGGGVGFDSGIWDQILGLGFRV